MSLARSTCRHNDLFELSKQLTQRRTESISQALDLKTKEELRECTHKPEINKKSAASKKSSVSVLASNSREAQEFTRTVNRLKSAQKSRSRVMHMLEARTTSEFRVDDDPAKENIGLESTGRKDKTRNEDNPFQTAKENVGAMTERSQTGTKGKIAKKQQVPLVVANVNLGKGRSDKLVLMEGMLVDDQIQAFAIRNSKSGREGMCVDIKKAAVEKLRETINQQLKQKKL